MVEYDPWAIYYDFIHEGLAGEAEFYVAQALARGADLLELGCGTGRITLVMGMSGVHVVGLDISGEMLSVCREKEDALGVLPGIVHLIQADMRSFSLARTFPLIAMPYRTFMHLLTAEAQEQCLRNVYQHLSPNGVFIFNTWASTPVNMAHLAATIGNGEFRAAEICPVDETVQLKHYHAAKIDTQQQLLLEKHRIEEVDSSGAIQLSRELTLTRALTTPSVLTRLFEHCDFEVEALLGNFAGDEFNESSSEMIWLLKKGTGAS
jgi:SAM-dependent methyltransferase